ncbi:hypothetical protein FRD01_01480 [Microvenator marinus]|jgi:hypothetical protein|uniref:DUF1795 domain-containing protein n=1 Tax=Microvenator marinus TaxID=2600177 RepID=A0A5B8XJK0_9DELT|nr:hypothetical protein [Microvenator marinus]QED25952.1 hypothetical protein FRD01_01480 [Microvenator marinus]
MKLVRLFIALLMCAALSSVAYAQDATPVENEEFGVTVTPPAKWEVAQGNDKAVANFKHRGSQSQIEVVGTKLITTDVADVFFKTFHKTLKESNFEEVSAGAEVTIGEHKGTQTSYKFTHSGVTLEVVIFQFLRENTAWIVVGYMQDVEKDTYLPDFQSVVTNMKFKG